MTTVVIRSAAFPGVYVRLDGAGVTKPVDSGGGKANCQFGAGPYETFNMVNNSDGTVSFGATDFPNVFLRLDGRGLTQPVGPGGGTVNAQYTVGPWEKFRLVNNGNGSVSIASVQFPNVFLRMDGTGVTKFSAPGGGVVNAQYTAGPWERFFISPPSAGLSRAEIDQAIQTYAPILHLNPQEQYLPCSIEAFLAHAKLHDKQTGQEINHPTQAQLPTGTNNDGRYWLILEDSFKGGDLPSAKAYVHAYWKPGLSYTDLQFWFCYAYNGPGTAHINGLAFDTIVHDGNPDLAPLGEHYGDWECAVVRIDNTSKQMIGAWLSQHSGGQWFNQGDLGQFRRTGQRINVYSSRNGHAVYAGVGSNYSEHRKYPSPAIPAGVEFFLRNDTADGGQTLDCAAKHELISADWLGVTEPNWVNYPYRWGPEGSVTHLSPKAVGDILEAALGWLRVAVGGRVVAWIAGQILSIFVTDDVNGPEGPKTKDTWHGSY